MLADRMTIDGTPIENLTSGSEKQVRLLCDNCSKETITQWNNYVQYQKKREWTGETTCQPCAARKSGKARKGKACPHTAARNRKQKGDKHPSWKGGRYVDPHGYVMINVKSGRPKNGSGWDNYKKEHVVIMEENIDRLLKKGEVVHHIDGDKLNNLLENLWLTNHKGHRNAHQSLQMIGYMLIRSNLIEFDKDSGDYIMSEQLRALLNGQENAHS